MYVLKRHVVDTVQHYLLKTIANKVCVGILYLLKNKTSLTSEKTKRYDTLQTTRLCKQNTLHKQLAL